MKDALGYAAVLAFLTAAVAILWLCFALVFYSWIPVSRLTGWSFGPSVLVAAPIGLALDVVILGVSLRVLSRMHNPKMPLAPVFGGATPAPVASTSPPAPAAASSSEVSMPISGEPEPTRAERLAALLEANKARIDAMPPPDSAAEPPAPPDPTYPVEKIQALYAEACRLQTEGAHEEACRVIHTSLGSLPLPWLANPAHGCGWSALEPAADAARHTDRTAARFVYRLLIEQTEWEENAATHAADVQGAAIYRRRIEAKI